MTVSVIGAGAFGTALAIALSADGTPVALWSRDTDDALTMQKTRTSGKRLPGYNLPDSLVITSDQTPLHANICLICVPAQSLAGFLAAHEFSDQAALVACSKGIDRQTGLGPVATIRVIRPSATAAILTGPSFAADIAYGMPTAITLATDVDAQAKILQSILTRPALRLYRSTDVIGAELGGALKNVIAIAAGIAIGAGLGDSARASVISRGFSELARFAQAKGAQNETIQGLSGLGDLVLTCTSEKSRNFMAGVALGKAQASDTSKTVEGLATAPVVAQEAERLGLDLPLIRTIAHVVEGQLDIQRAIETLLARPVGKE